MDRSAQTNECFVKQVEDLTNLLHRTNQTMAENEDKLAYFHDITRSKSRQLKKDDEECCSLQVPPRGRAVQHGGLSPSTAAEMSSKHQQNSRNQTPREPKDGWRDTYVESTDEFSDDSSKEWSELSHQHCTTGLKELAADLKSVKMILQKNEKMNDNETSLLVLSRELAGSKDALLESHREIDKLSSKLNIAAAQLEKSIEDRKMALDQLELSSQSLSEAEKGNKELLNKLLRSEEARQLSEDSYTELLKQSRLQNVVCEELAAKVKAVEAELDEYHKQRVVCKESHEFLQQKLSERIQSEATLSEKCRDLMKKLDKHELKEEEAEEEMKHKLISAQLHSELRTAQQEKSRLIEEMHHNESELLRYKEIQNRLNKDVMDLTAKVIAANEDKKDLLGKLEVAFNRLQYSEEQNTALQLQMEKLNEMKRRGTCNLVSLKSFKKYKSRSKVLAEELRGVTEERNQAMDKYEAMKCELADRQSILEESNKILEEEKAKLKLRVDQLELKANDCKHQNEQFQLENARLQSAIRIARKSIDKYQSDLHSLESEKELLLANNASLNEDINLAIEQRKECEHKMQESLKKAGDQTRAERLELQHEVQTLRIENTQLHAKMADLSKSYQGELLALRSNESELRRTSDSLNKDLEKLQVSSAMKERQLNEQLECLKLSHAAEMSHLSQQHQDLVSDLAQKTNSLQTALMEEQALVHAMRRQQFSMLDGHYKIGEDLSKSLDDNEKLMRKYLRMKRQLKSTSMDDLEVGDYTTVIPVMNERSCKYLPTRHDLTCLSESDQNKAWLKREMDDVRAQEESLKRRLLNPSQVCRSDS